MSQLIDSLSSLPTVPSSFSGSAPRSAQTDPTLQNTSYQVLLVQHNKKQPLIVLGSVPEEFQLSQDVGWKAPWGAGIAGSGLVGDLLAATGNRLVTQVMTMQVWQGENDSLSFTVVFEFNTWKDPVADIVDPIKALMQMSMPGLGAGGFLTSPGPVLTAAGVKNLTQTVGGKIIGAGQAISAAGANAIKNGSIESVSNVVQTAVNSVAGIISKDDVEKNLENRISINIGTWFQLDNIIIKQVNHTYKPQVVDALTGTFQSATVSVTFAPMFALTTADIPNLIKVRNLPSSLPSVSAGLGSGLSALDVPSSVLNNSGILNIVPQVSSIAQNAANKAASIVSNFIP